MTINKDKLITTPLPFLKGRTVLYVGGSKDSRRSYVVRRRKKVRSLFNDAGYSFLFLPDLLDSLEPQIIGYYFPGLQEGVQPEGLYQRIRSIAGIDDNAGFLYNDEGNTYFHILPDSSDRLIREDVKDFVQYLSSLEYSHPEPIIFGDSGLFDNIVEEEEVLPPPTVRFEKEEYSVKEDVRFRLGTSEDKVAYEESEGLDPRAQAIIDAWKEIERKFGITIEDLSIILDYNVKLSRLIITTSNRISLPDLEGNPEVKLDDLTKALYFFYLRHPSGAAFKELQDYEDEIYRIYMGITGRDDVEGIRKSVSALVAPYSDGRNSCVSRIKKAFRDIVGDRIARYYYIDGRYAETRFVRIDRDLVIWEH